MRKNESNHDDKWGSPKNFLDTIEFSHEKTSTLLRNILGKTVDLKNKNEKIAIYNGPENSNLSTFTKSVRFSLNQNLNASLRSWKSKGSKNLYRKRLGKLMKPRGGTSFKKLGADITTRIPRLIDNTEEKNSLTNLSHENSISNKNDNSEKGQWLDIKNMKTGFRRSMTQKEDPRTLFAPVGRQSPNRRFSRNMDKIPVFAFDELGKTLYENQNDRENDFSILTNENHNNRFAGSSGWNKEKDQKEQCGACYVRCETCERLDILGTSPTLKISSPVISSHKLGSVDLRPVSIFVKSENNVRDKTKEGDGNRGNVIETPHNEDYRESHELNQDQVEVRTLTQSGILICTHGKLVRKRCPIHQKNPTEHFDSCTDYNFSSPNNKKGSVSSYSPTKNRDQSEASTRSGNLLSTKLGSSTSPNKRKIEIASIKPKHSIIKEEESYNLKKSSSEGMDSNSNEHDKREKSEQTKILKDKEPLQDKVKKAKAKTEKPNQRERNPRSILKITKKAMNDIDDCESNFAIKNQAIPSGYDEVLSRASKSRKSVAGLAKKKVQFTRKDRVIIVKSYKKYNKFDDEDLSCCQKLFRFFSSSHDSE